MRLILVLSFLILAPKAYSQTIFTDVFAPDRPTDLHIIDDELYVGAYFGGYLAKVPLNDPTSVTIVSNDFATGEGPLKMDYDPSTNVIYTGIFTSFVAPGCYQIDLNQSFPTDAEFYTSFQFFQGLDIEDSTLLYSGTDAQGESGRLYTIDLNVGPSSAELIYVDPDGGVRAPIVYDGYIYFGSPDLINNNSAVYKIDASDPNPEREYIATVSEQTIQSSLLHGKYLFLGIATGGNESKIVRLDLESTKIPRPQEEIVSNFKGGIFGMAISEDNLYFTEGGTGIIWVLNDPSLSFEESRIGSFKLYPNPTNDSVFLKGEIDINTSYKIYGVGGDKLLQGRYSSGGINLARLSKGIYFVTIENDMGRQTKKIVKK